MCPAPRWVLSIPLYVSALVGCGATEGELKTPSYLWNHESGLCGGTRVVDGDRGLWTEGGCENGAIRLAYQRTIEESQFDRIVAAFAAHPGLSDFSRADCESGLDYHRFTERAADGKRRDWYVCIQASDQEVLLPAAFPSPFDETVRAYLDL